MLRVFPRACVSRQTCGCHWTIDACLIDVNVPKATDKNNFRRRFPCVHAAFIAGSLYSAASTLFAMVTALNAL